MSWRRVVIWCRERFSGLRLTSAQLWGVVSLGAIILVVRLVRWLVV
jgi:hypothetical protein